MIKGGGGGVALCPTVTRELNEARREHKISELSGLLW